MVIDFHTHVFPDKIAASAMEKLGSVVSIKGAYDGTARGLIDAMRRDGISYSVILPVATRPGQVETINAFAASLDGKDGIVSFAGIHPHCENWKELLSDIRARGFKGVKLHPEYQQTDIDDARYVRIIRECARLGLIVLAHAGDDMAFPGSRRCIPERVRDVLPELGDAVLIMAHYGGHGHFDDAVKYLADTDVYIDTSYSLNEFGPQACIPALKSFKPERILFGSDGPWLSQRRNVEFIKSLKLAYEDDILYKNARRLLGL